MTDLATLGLQIDSASAVQASAALDKMVASGNQAGAAADAVTAAAGKTSAAVKQVEASANAAAVGLKNTAAGVTSNVVAFDSHSAALGRHSQAMGVNRMQQMELIHVGKSLFDQMAAGQSITRALTVEGGRLGEIFASGGGVAGVFTSASSALTGFLTPAKLATSGVLAIGAAALYAENQYESLQRKLQGSMTGLGRANGLTLGGLDDLAGRGASIRGGYSTAASMSAVATYGAAGLDANTIGALNPLTARYAKLTGTGTDEAASSLASAFSDPAHGADELSKKLGLLDDATKQLIETQTRAYDLEGARRTLTNALANDLANEPIHETVLQKVRQSLGTALSDAFTGLGSIVNKSLGDYTSEEALKSALGNQGDQNGVLSILAGGAPSPGGDALKAWATATEEAAKRLRAAQDLESNALSLRAGDAVRAANPLIGERADLTGRRDLLTRAIGDPDVLRKMGVSAEEANRALDITTNRLGLLRSAAEVVAENSGFAVQATLARSLAERVAVEGQRAYTETLRTSGDRALASATAEAKRNEMIAQGAKAVMDSLRDSTNERALVGLSPYERNLAQVQQQHDKLLRDNVVTDGATAATVRLTTALDRNADALSGKAAATGLTAVGTAGGGSPVVASGSVPDMIRASAAKYGIDPDTALRVAQSEGGFSPALGGDHGTSFGPFQLHYGGGMGDDFTRKTGLDARDPNNVGAGIDYALSQAARVGWGPFHGAARVGIGQFDGIGGRTASAQAGSGTSILAMANTDLSNRQFNATTGQFIDAIDSSNRALEVETATLKLQNDLLGQTPQVVAAMTKQQDLLNAAYSRGSISTLDFAKQTDDLQAKLKGAGAAAADYATKQQDQQRAIAIGDLTRTGFSSSLHTVSDDIMNGRTRDIGRDVGRGLATKTIDSGIDTLTSGLFGKQGTAGGGLFGSLFGGASSALSTANIQAAVVNLTGGASMLGGLGGGGGALGGLFGGGANNAAQDAAQDAAEYGVGSSGGGFFSGLASLFAFADGGIMGPGGPISLRRYAMGGIANTPQFSVHGEGSVPEAYVPLADGRSIPVSVKGGGGGGGDQHFHAGDNTIVVQGSADKSTMEQMRRELQASEARTQANLKRNFGGYQRQYGAYHG